MIERIVSFLGFFALSMIGLGTAMAQNHEEGKRIYGAYCTACHGEKGKGNGMAAQSLPVRPADHTNGAVMNQYSDKFLIEVISKGGSAVGKSSFMPAWENSFNEKQIRDIVAYLKNHCRSSL
jgi:mono/diheme cytochrome c family protein